MFSHDVVGNAKSVIIKTRMLQAGLSKGFNMSSSLPSDAGQAAEALKQRKIALLDVLESVSTNRLTTISQLSGEILNTIEEIDFKLEKGNFWDE